MNRSGSLETQGNTYNQQKSKNKKGLKVKRSSSLNEKKKHFHQSLELPANIDPKRRESKSKSLVNSLVIKPDFVLSDHTDHSKNRVIASGMKKNGVKSIDSVKFTENEPPLDFPIYLNYPQNELFPIIEDIGRKVEEENIKQPLPSVDTLKSLKNSLSIINEVVENQTPPKKRSTVTEPHPKEAEVEDQTANKQQQQNIENEMFWSNLMNPKVSPQFYESQSNSKQSQSISIKDNKSSQNHESSLSQTAQKTNPSNEFPQPSPDPQNSFILSKLTEMIDILSLQTNSINKLQSKQNALINRDPPKKVNNTNIPIQKQPEQNPKQNEEKNTISGLGNVNQQNISNSRKSEEQRKHGLIENQNLKSTIRINPCIQEKRYHLFRSPYLHDPFNFSINNFAPNYIGGKGSQITEKNIPSLSSTTIQKTTYTQKFEIPPQSQSPSYPPSTSIGIKADFSPDHILFSNKILKVSATYGITVSSSDSQISLQSSSTIEKALRIQITFQNILPRSTLCFSASVRTSNSTNKKNVTLPLPIDRVCLIENQKDFFNVFINQYDELQQIWLSIILIEQLTNNPFEDTYEQQIIHVPCSLSRFMIFDVTTVESFFEEWGTNNNDTSLLRRNDQVSCEGNLLNSLLPSIIGKTDQSSPAESLFRIIFPSLVNYEAENDLKYLLGRFRFLNDQATGTNYQIKIQLPNKRNKSIIIDFRIMNSKTYAQLPLLRVYQSKNLKKISQIFSQAFLTTSPY